MRAQRAHHAQDGLAAKRGVLDRGTVAHGRDQRDHAAFDEQHVIDLLADFMQYRGTGKLHEPQLRLQQPEFFRRQRGKEQIRVGLEGQGVGIGHSGASFIAFRPRGGWLRASS